MTLYAGTGSVGTVLCSSVGTTNVSLSGSFLADGVYSFSYTETDTHGNTSGFSPAVSVILDYTIPEPATILSPENASLISDTSPTLTGTGTPGDMVFLSAIL